METTEKPPMLNIPAAIIIAGLIVAGAVVYVDKKGSSGGPGVVDNGAAAIALAPVTKDDHLSGSRRADLVIVEYSDAECPFCKRFHGTMNKVMEKYGDDKKVAWVYRHFPLDAIHPKARKEAEAQECAGELGGNDAFWEYTQTLFDITPSNNGLDLAILPDIATQIGLDATRFTECLDSGKYADHVASDLASGTEAGVRGTPASFIVTKKGAIIPITGGAQPFDVVDALIKQSL